jgi:hypothetical protein
MEYYVNKGILKAVGIRDGRDTPGENVIAVGGRGA